jgi:hypothetical protein
MNASLEKLGFWYGNFSCPGTMGGEGFVAAFTETDGGEFVLVGSAFSVASSERDDTEVWLRGADRVGRRTWSEVYGGLGDDDGRSIAQTQDGGFVVLGTSTSASTTQAAYVIKVPPPQ